MVLCRLGSAEMSAPDPAGKISAVCDFECDKCKGTIKEGWDCYIDGVLLICYLCFKKDVGAK